MKMKTLLTFTLAAACVISANAAAKGSRRQGPVGADGGKTVAQGREAIIQIDTPARPGGTCLAEAPVYTAQIKGQLLPPIGGKPRKWIVLEMKYTTQAKWQDELTFNWHVLLDSSKATEKDPKNLPAPYSYYNTTVRYVDIRRGGHMACVCLPPSVYERFGEPMTVSVLITNKDGDELAFHTENSFGKLPEGKWWENDKMMNQWKDKKGDAMIERRNGLLDRSKTPFMLINNADYELVQ